jgi:hypothetical protein
MISAPYDYSSLSLTFAQLLGLSAPAIAQWQPTTEIYAIAPNAPADTFRLGQGYWARFQSAVNLSVAGIAASGSSQTLSVSGGWNQIADPYPVAVSLSNLAIQQGAGAQMSFATASGPTENLVSPVVFSYDPTAGNYVAHYVGNPAEPNPVLNPWVGYWFFADVAVNVIVPNPSAG